VADLSAVELEYARGPHAPPRFPDSFSTPAPTGGQRRKSRDTSHEKSLRHDLEASGTTLGQLERLATQQEARNKLVVNVLRGGCALDIPVRHGSERGAWAKFLRGGVCQWLPLVETVQRRRGAGFDDAPG
jgi:hypothetical protein